MNLPRYGAIGTLESFQGQSVPSKKRGKNYFPFNLPTNHSLFICFPSEIKFAWQSHLAHTFLHSASFRNEGGSEFKVHTESSRGWRCTQANHSCGLTGFQHHGIRKSGKIQKKYKWIAQGFKKVIKNMTVGKGLRDFLSSSSRCWRSLCRQIRFFSGLPSQLAAFSSAFPALRRKDVSKTPSISLLWVIGKQNHFNRFMLSVAAFLWCPPSPPTMIRCGALHKFDNNFALGVMFCVKPKNGTASTVIPTRIFHLVAVGSKRFSARGWEGASK